MISTIRLTLIHDMVNNYNEINKYFRHLGSHRKVYTPIERGFQSHIGYWTGHEDYYDHTAQEMYKPVVRNKIFRENVAQFKDNFKTFKLELRKIELV